MSEKIITPEKIRERIHQYMLKDIHLNPKVRSAMIGNFQKACKLYVDNNDDPRDPRAIRLLIWSYLIAGDDEPFELYDTSSLMRDSFILGISRWQYGASDGNMRETFLSELTWVIYRANYGLARARKEPAITMGELESRWGIPEEHKDFVDWAYEIHGAFVHENELEPADEEQEEPAIIDDPRDSILDL